MAHGSIPSDSIADRAEIDRDRADAIVAGLARDGLIEHEGERISLPA